MKCQRGETGLPGPTGKASQTGRSSAHKGHLFKFLRVVRSRNVGDLRADVLEGHLSTALVHMANISYRLGTPHTVEAAREAITPRGTDAADALARCREHLAVNGVDGAKARFVVGPWLETDPKTERFIGKAKTAARANELVKPPYRKPFAVPENV